MLIMNIQLFQNHLKALYCSARLLLDVKKYFTSKTLLQSPTRPSYDKNGDELLTQNIKTKPRTQISAPSFTQYDTEIQA